MLCEYMYVCVMWVSVCTSGAQATQLLLILKWGGELTSVGQRQAEELGRAFRCMYPGGEGEYASLPGSGFLRLHSTYRHDLKVYASDEGRVQMTAAAFTKVNPPPSYTVRSASYGMGYFKQTPPRRTLAHVCMSIACSTCTCIKISHNIKTPVTFACSILLVYTSKYTEQNSREGAAFIVRDLPYFYVIFSSVFIFYLFYKLVMMRCTCISLQSP